MQDAKNRHFGTVAQFCQAVFSQLRHVNTNTSSTCLHDMVNFGLLTAEISWRVWGTPANFNGFRVLAVLLRGTLVVGVSQILQRWTEGATYIGQGGHHVGHWAGPHSSVWRLSLIKTLNKHEAAAWLVLFANSSWVNPNYVLLSLLCRSLESRYEPWSDGMMANRNWNLDTSCE